MPSGRNVGSSALTGGSIGTAILPGVGTAIGAGAGALLGLFGGGDDDASSGHNPNIDNVTKQISDRAAKTSASAVDLKQQGGDALAPVMKYLQALSSGDPSAVAQATAPERRRVIDQYDSAAQTIAQFGPRGGGATAANAQAQYGKANAISDITANARTSATKELGSLGTQLTGLGLSADQLASADLNTILANLTAKRGQTLEAWSGIGQAAGSILGQYLGRDNS